MSNIASLCKTPDDDDNNVDVEMEVPINQPPVESEELNEVEMEYVLDCEKTNSDNLFSHNRWSLHNSYIRESEDKTEKQTDTESEDPAIGNEQNNVQSKGPLEKLFGHIFKPRSKVQFGRVLVPGSDDDSD